MTGNAARPGRWLRQKLRTASRLSRGEITPATVIKNKWYKFKRFLILNEIEEIPLNRLLIGRQCGIPLEQWVKNTGDHSRISTLLQDSPYVALLSEIDSDPTLLQDKARLLETPYYRMAEIGRQYTGNFMGKSDQDAILDWMREFYAFYTAARTETEFHSDIFQDEGHSAATDPVQVFKIRDSDCYEIIDGHHRCAIAFQCGRITIPAEIAGSDSTYLQRLIFRARGDKKTILDQPIEAPEVEKWPVTADCRAILALKCRFLRERSMLLAGTTYLDIPCGFGYSLKTFKQEGLHVFGVDPDETVLQITKIVHGIAPDECCLQEISDFLAHTENTFEIVSCNLPLELSQPESTGILAGLDKITEKVLFLQMAAAGKPVQKDPKTALDDLICGRMAFRETFLLEKGIVACVK